VELPIAPELVLTIGIMPRRHRQLRHR
jgi:hypothetical protein